MASVKLVIGIGLAAAITTVAILLAQPIIPDTTERPVGVEEAEGSFSSPYVKEFQLVNGTWPNGMLVDTGGTVWTVAARSHSLVSFDPASSEAKYYPIPGGSESPTFVMAWAIAEGKDGSILFPGTGDKPLWRFDPVTEKFQLIDSVGGLPLQVRVDGEQIWYTVPSGIVGVVQKDGEEYEVKEIDVGGESFPSGIFVQNQTVWITKSLEGKIIALHVSTKGAEVTEITEAEQFPADEALITPTDIILAGESAWVTEHNTSFLTKYDTEIGKTTRYPTSLHSVHVVTLPYWLESGDGGIWFNEHRGNRIGFFDFSDDTLIEYEIPTRNPEAGNIANVLTIHTDPADKNKLWFTEFTEDKIGYVDRSVPVPFDIDTIENRVVLEEGQTAKINIKIVRKPGTALFNNTLSFNVSSSASTSGVLVNATTNFLPATVDLSAANSHDVVLEVADQGLQKGPHMLAISATDGAVVRTVYLEMVIH